MSSNKRHRWGRKLLPVPLVAATVPLVLAGVMSAADASPSQAGSSAGAVPVAADAGAAPMSWTMLPTGDVVRMTSIGGHPTTSVQPADASGWTRNITQTTLAGHRYVIPAEARPFIGTFLDKSLFDVTDLPARTGSVAVSVGVAPGAKPTIPGLTVTSRSASTLSGTLSRTGTAQFRAALAKAAIAASSPSRTRPTSLFGGMTSMTIASPGGAVATPAYAQVSLNIKVLDTQGKPVAFNAVELVNMDDSARYAEFIGVDDGSTRISVPKGNYTAITQIDNTNGDTLVATHVVTVNDFAVTTDLQTLTLDGRKATTRPTVTTPQPTIMQRTIVEIDREPVVSGDGPMTFYTTTDPSFALYVSPTPQVRVGQLHFINEFRAANPTTSKAAYAYDLVYRTDGRIPTQQAKTVPTAQLAHISADYYSVSPHTGLLQRSPIFGFGDFYGDVPLPLNVPAHRDEYILAPADTRWQDVFIGSSTDDNPYGSYVQDGERTYLAGKTTKVDWLRGPLGGGVQEAVPGDTSYICGACRTSNSMSLTMAEVKDTVLGHSGFVFPANNATVTYFSIRQSSSTLYSANNKFGGIVSVPTSNSLYRVELDVDRTVDGVKNSSDTQTSLSFPSSATNGSPMPAGWQCDLTPASKCRVLPILTASLPIPTSLTYQLPVGATTVPLTIGRIAGGGTSTITAAAVSISIDATNWVPATLVRTGNGTYQATLNNPAAWAGKYVFVHLEGVASDGATIDQNVTNAYRVAPTA